MADGRIRIASMVAFFFLVGAALALSVMVSGDNTLAIDLRISRAVQDRGFLGDRWIEALGYWVGSSAIALPFVLLVALWQLRNGQRWVAALLIGAAAMRPVNVLTKILIGSPRPTAEQVEVLRQSSGNGFPSGHVYGTVLIAGALFLAAPVLSASRLRCVLIRVCAALALVATAYSRVASGAHWPSDVLGGLLWGTVALLIVVAVVDRWFKRPPRLRPVGTTKQTVEGR